MFKHFFYSENKFVNNTVSYLEKLNDKYINTIFMAILDFSRSQKEKKPKAGA